MFLIESVTMETSCKHCDGTGYTCKGACFGKPTCDGKRCPNGCTPEGLIERAARAIRDDVLHKEAKA